MHFVYSGVAHFFKDHSMKALWTVDSLLFLGLCCLLREDRVREAGKYTQIPIQTSQKEKPPKQFHTWFLGGGFNFLLNYCHLYIWERFPQIVTSIWNHQLDFLDSLMAIVDSLKPRCRWELPYIHPCWWRSRWEMWSVQNCANMATS